MDYHVHGTDDVAVDSGSSHPPPDSVLRYLGGCSDFSSVMVSPKTQIIIREQS